jgi:hypothetical protein
MPNDNPTPLQWEKLDDQRKAGLAFLRAVLADDNLRNDVVADPGKAKQEFKAKGGIPIPDDVEIVCIDSTEEARRKVVVLLLPEKGTSLPSDLSVLQFWPLGWTPYSSARFKRDIQKMGRKSSSILRLRPVTFRYKRDMAPDGLSQFGLVAEEVEKTNPDLVLRDGSGQVYGVRYDAVNAMLLNEFIKQNRTVEKQGAILTEQRRAIQELVTKVNTLTSTPRSRGPRRTKSRRA